MKNLFVLALALIMSCTFAFAQSQSPYSKGKYFGKKMIELAFSEDEAAADKLGNDVEKYINNYVETEEQLENFLDGLESGIYEACDEYGLGEDIADQIVEAFATELLAELEELGLI